MAHLTEARGRRELERLFLLVGLVFVLSGVGLGLTLLGVPFAAEPFVVWGALGMLAAAATLPVVAWSRGRSYRFSTTGQVGIVLLPIAGLAVGLAALPSLAHRIAALERTGWLLLLVAGCLLLIHLTRASDRDGSPAPVDRFAPAYGNRPNRFWDDAARWQVIAGNGYVVLAAMFGLHGGWDGSAADATGLVLWYGWLGSLACAASLYYFPRLFGARGQDEAPLRIGLLLWHAGVVLSVLSGRRGLLLLTLLGGAVLFAVFVRLLQGALRRSLRVVGSRRSGLDSPLRQLLFLGIVFGLLASLTVPWWSGLHNGASHILWTWLLFLFIPVAVHVFHPVRVQSVTVVGVLSAGVLGGLLGIWGGTAAAVGGGFLVVCLLGVGTLMLWHDLWQARVRVLGTHSSGGTRQRKP